MAQFGSMVSVLLLGLVFVHTSASVVLQPVSHIADNTILTGNRCKCAKVDRVDGPMCASLIKGKWDLSP